MRKNLSEFWGRLEDTVHPSDIELLTKSVDHAFNLEFPPPAFLGDVESAPVLILDNNGGYHPVLTPSEFAAKGARKAYLRMLGTSAPVPQDATHISPYYKARNYWHYLVSGEAALVNGVAYRSIDGKQTQVAQLSSRLPSARYHQAWLREEILPAVRRGERFVVVHRWTRWNGATDSFKAECNAVFSNASVNPNLSKVEIAAMQAFLSAR